MGCAPSRATGVEPSSVKGGEMGAAGANGGSRQGSLHRQDSGHSSVGSKQRRSGLRGRNGPATAGNSNQQSNGVHHPLGGSSAPTSDPRWIQLWRTHQELLLDPADVHATMEACMARMTNQLSVAEMTFLQRKVRSVVRSCNSFPSHEKSRMTNILRSNHSTHGSQEVETKMIAEKFHLLSNHAVRKILPRLPSAPADHSLGKPVESNGVTNGTKG